MADTYRLPTGTQQVTGDQFTAYWNKQFAADPVMQQIFREEQSRTGKTSEKDREKRATQRAKELGWAAPSKDWSVDWDKGGFRTERKGYFGRNKDWLIPLIVGGATLGVGALAAGGAAAAGAAGGGGAAAGGAAGAAGAAAPTLGAMGVASGVPAGLGTAASFAPLAPAVTGAAGAAGTTLATNVATKTATSPGFWGKVLGNPQVVSGLTSIGGNIISGINANKTANDLADAATAGQDEQRAAREEAARVSREMYDTTRADLGPYRNVGGAAMSTLGNLMGLGDFSAAPIAEANAPLAAANTTGRAVPRELMPSRTPPPTAPVEAPVEVGPEAQAGNLEAAAQRTRSSYVEPAGRAVPRQAPSRVPLIAPTGEVQEVDENDVDGLVALGAQRMY